MDRFELEIRREPPPGPIPTESEPHLVGRIRVEIAGSGPMTFARFMELALYDPEYGYYRSAAPRPGRQGDFLTAPEAHPLFGAALARQLDEVWQRLGEPATFVLREYGAGSGTLAVAILRALHGEGPGGSVIRSEGLSRAIRYAPIEINEHRLSELADRLTSAGFGAALELDLPADRPMVGVSLANEFLDALPVHRVEARDGGLAELFVDVTKEGFAELPGPPSDPRLERRLTDEGIRLAEGVRAEVCLGVEPWVSEVAAGLQRGCALVIDYGYPAADLYAPERAGGTLRAYAGQRVHDDPFVAIGRQDLTAHVDFTAVERAAQAAGLDLLGRTSQAEFLVGAGGEEIVEAIRSDPATSREEWLTARSAIARMVDPRRMGQFGVLAFGRNVASGPRLRGLAYRLTR